MKKKFPKNLTRDASFDASTLDKEKRTIELSVSSDTPIERYFGMEILDHKAEAIDLSRLNAGATPLLFNHDRDFHIGKALSGGTDGKQLSVQVIFSRSKAGQEKFQDVCDGILTEVSIGYSISEMILESSVDGVDTYRILAWALNEVSMVTIPADYSVGVDRGKDNEDFLEIEVDNTSEREQKENTMKRKGNFFKETPSERGGNNLPAPATVDQPQPPKVEVIREETLTEDRKRIAEIRAIEKSAAERQKIDVSATARKFEMDGKSAEDFRKHILDNDFPGITPVRTGEGKTGMDENDIRKFSMARAIRQMASKKGLQDHERDCCDAAAKALKREAGEMGFIVPEEVLNYDVRGHLVGQRAQAVSPASAGGFLVQTNVGPVIEILRNNMVLGRAGITILSGLVGDVALPTQTGTSTAYWVDENGQITDSQSVFGQKTLTPHRLGCTIPYSNQLLAQTSMSVEAFIRDDMQKSTAIAKDLAGLLGTGVAGQPVGVANYNGINQTVTYGGAAVWGDVVEHETGIAVDNADIGSMKFVLSAAAVGKWKTILRDSVAGAKYLIDDGMTANGYEVLRSNQVSGANQSFFGVWNQLVMGQWAGMEVVVDPYTLAKKSQVQVTINELVDFLIRQATAFNVSTDSAAQ